MALWQCFEQVRRAFGLNIMYVWCILMMYIDLYWWCILSHNFVPLCADCDLQSRQECIIVAPFMVAGATIEKNHAPSLFVFPQKRLNVTGGLRQCLMSELVSLAVMIYSCVPHILTVSGLFPEEGGAQLALHQFFVVLRSPAWSKLNPQKEWHHWHPVQPGSSRRRNDNCRTTKCRTLRHSFSSFRNGTLTSMLKTTKMTCLWACWMTQPVGNSVLMVTTKID